MSTNKSWGLLWSEYFPAEQACIPQEPGHDAVYLFWSCGGFIRKRLLIKTVTWLSQENSKYTVYVHFIHWTHPTLTEASFTNQSRSVSAEQCAALMLWWHHNWSAWVNKLTSVYLCGEVLYVFRLKLNDTSKLPTLLQACPFGFLVVAQTTFQRCANKGVVYVQYSQ